MNISHEFRSPLTVILGMADKIQDNIKTNNLAGIHHGAKLVKNSAQRLIQLVTQLMDLGKLESSAFETHPYQADIIPFINYLSESYHSLAEDKGVTIETHHTTKKVIMDFDPDIIQKIVTNLLSNAIKFTRKTAMWKSKPRLKIKS